MSEMPNANATRGRLAWRAASLTLLTGAASLGLAWVLATSKMPCGFARAFHVPCPGCGSTRAMLCLFHGDVAGMLRMNPVAPLVCALLVAFVAQVLVSLATTGGLARLGSGLSAKITVRGLVAVFVLEVAIWLLRFAGFFGGPVPV